MARETNLSSFVDALFVDATLSAFVSGRYPLFYFARTLTSSQWSCAVDSSNDELIAFSTIMAVWCMAAEDADTLCWFSVSISEARSCFLTHAMHKFSAATCDHERQPRSRRGIMPFRAK